MNDKKINYLDDDPHRSNGFHDTDVKCKCGGNMRIHSYIFKQDSDSSEQKFYGDCTCCSNVTGWKHRSADVIEEFLENKQA